MNRICIYLFFSVIVYGLTINSSRAQDDDATAGLTHSIKDTYNYIQLKINRNQYYLNEYKVNSQNLRWKDDEVYQVTHQYYYSFKGKSVASLRLIKVISRIGDKHYQQEYLYDLDGQLVFCYEKQNDDGKYDYRELRAYFDKGLCINLKLDEDIIDAKAKGHEPKLNDIKANADIYVRRFREDMSILEN